METTAILTAILLLAFPSRSESAPSVKYGGVTVTGNRRTFSGKEVNEFLGIPYAEPPIGDLRFKPTVPFENKEQTIEAVQEPAACLQLSEYPFPWFDNSSFQDEDCLYLNIWSPSGASAANPRAVMYWMYGGGFRLGSIVKDVYDGIALAALGDIVVVTVNYRIGALGFFASGTDEAPGNAGLWDVLEGLRWVNKNIQAFGGDPDQVTISGESAGSIFVGLLSISPLSKGLFNRQIMESGSPAFHAFDNNTQNIGTGQKFAELLGCANSSTTLQSNPEDVTKCLKSVDAKEFLKKESLVNPRSSSDFLPQYGDAIMPTNPREAVLKGNLQCTSMLMGNNKDEGAHRITIADPELFGFFGEKDPRISKSMGKEMLLKNFSMPEYIINHYLPDSLGENDYDQVRRQTYTAVGDTSLLCPTVYHADTCAQKGETVYFYFWKHRPSNNPWAPWMGATHFSEVQFVFGKPLLEPQKYSKAEPSISNDMVLWWSNFVKYGTPTKGDFLTVWPSYGYYFPFYKKISSDKSFFEMTVGIGVHKESCDFLKPYFGY